MTIQPWYPGLIQASLLDDDAAELTVGPTVGWVHQETLLDRREPWCVVAKAAVDGARPEDRIPAARYPHLHRAARACPLMAVEADPRAWRGDLDPGTRHLSLRHGDVLVFDGVVDGEDVHGAQLLDRLLRELSTGELWEDGVLLALELAVAARWPALERTFSQLHGGAGTRAATARRWVSDLQALEGPGRLAGLGEVTSEVLPATTVGGVALPPFPRWILRAPLQPLEWPEAGSERRVATRSKAESGRLALGLTVGAAGGLALAVSQGLADAQLVRLLAVFLLAGLWLAMRARR